MPHKFEGQDDHVKGTLGQACEDLGGIPLRLLDDTVADLEQYALIFQAIGDRNRWRARQSTDGGKQTVVQF